MEASASALLQVPHKASLLSRGSGDWKMVPRPRRVRVGGGGFSDEGHLRYYASSGRREGEAKRRMKLANTLSRDLSALMSAGFGLEEEDREGLMGDGCAKMTISEAAQVLLSRLEQVRAKAKDTKKKKRKEGNSMKKIMDCDKSGSSSSESSESSNSDCEEELINTRTLRTTAPVDVMTVGSTVAGSLAKDENQMFVFQEATEILLAPSEQVKAKEKDMMKKKKRKEEESMKKMKDCDEFSNSSSESSESSDSDHEEEVLNMSTSRSILPVEVMPVSSTIAGSSAKDEKLQMAKNTLEENIEIHSSLNCATECSSSSSSIGTNTTVSKASMVEARSPPSSSAVGVTGDKIEVCMGGKCKKSGALQLMEEFERRVGAGGAVVGCRCMGKCKEGPNVRILNHQKEEEASVTKPRNPLCIGVGLEDVSAIVSNYFGERSLGIQTC